MTDAIANEDIIFITNIIASGSAFGQRSSDGDGVFIPPAVFRKLADDTHIGDAVRARMIPNNSDIEGRLPHLAIMLAKPIDKLADQPAEKIAPPSRPTVKVTDFNLIKRVMDVLNDDEYEDRWFTVEDMCDELGLTDARRNIVTVQSALKFCCNLGKCVMVSAYTETTERVWFTAEKFRPE